MKELKRYEIFHSWGSMGTNMKRHEEESNIGEWYKKSDVDELITDHKAVVETMQKRIEELEGERLNINELRDQFENNFQVTINKRPDLWNVYFSCARDNKLVMETK